MKIKINLTYTSDKKKTMKIIDDTTHLVSTHKAQLEILMQGYDDCLIGVSKALVSKIEYVN